MDKRKNMKQLNENIFHQYNKWKTGYVRKENSIQMRLDNFLSNDRNSCSCYISEDGKHVDCDGDIYIFDEDLIDGKLPLPFGKIHGDFNCDGCAELISLEGAPEKVGRSFYINNCSNLISLEGAPKKVGRLFACSRCESLTSLEHLPKEIDRELVVDKRFEGQIPSDIKILKIRYTE